MQRISIKSFAPAFGLFAATVTSAFAAGSGRTAVSVNGVDTNPCIPAAPCRTINYALTLTAPGGELFILNSGGYGAFTINQSVKIVAPGGNLAALTAPAGNGITISAGPTDVVYLDGFYIDGSGTGTAGVKVNSVAALLISNSSILGFSTGIDFSPANTVTVPGLQMNNVRITQTATAVSVVPTSGLAGSHSARVFIEDCNFRNGSLIFDSSTAVGRISAQINRTSMQSNNSSVVANSPTGVGSYVQIMGSAIFESTTAFTANGANATILVGNSNISHVATVSDTQNAGQIFTFGTNQIYNYTTLGTLTPRPLQ